MNKKKVLLMINHLSMVIIIASFIGLLFYCIRTAYVLYNNIHTEVSIIGYTCLILIIEFTIVHEITKYSIYQILIDEKENNNGSR